MINTDDDYTSDKSKWDNWRNRLLGVCMFGPNSRITNNNL